MASITYSIRVSPQDVIFKGGGTFSATLTRNETPPSGATPTKAVVKFTNIRVWSTKYPYIQFGDYFTTNGLQNTSGEFLEVECASFSSDILNTSSADITATVKGVGSTVNAFDFNSSSVTLVVEYDQSYGKSTASLSSSNLNAGSNMTVSFNNDNIYSVYHKVTWSFGSYSNTVTTSIGSTSASYTIPFDWINAIPNAVSGTGTVAIATYASDSSYVGSNSYVFTLNVPSTVVPSIGSITATRIDNSVPSSWGIYVQNRSGVTLTASNASGSYGSTISSYKFSGSVSSTQTSNTLTISPITLSGTQTFYVSVTDSRGRSSGTVSCSISVSAYTSPTVSSAVAFRCNSSGTSNEEGTYAGVRVETSYTNQGGKNSLSISCQYQKVGDSSWTTGQSSMVSGTTYVIGSGNLSTNYTYHVRFQQTDVFGTVEKIIDVSTTQYTIFFRKGGTGIGLGKACERDNAVELNPNWNFYYGDVDLIAKINAAAGINVPTIIYSSSQPAGSAGAIWLKPKS